MPPNIMEIETEKKSDNPLTESVSESVGEPVSKSASRPGMKWYIIHVHSRFEDKIAEDIRERAASAEWGSHIGDVLVPVEEVLEVSQGKKHAAKRRFFPGYLLLQADMSDDVRHFVKNLPRVTGFLGADSRPAPVPIAEVERIQKQMQEGTEKPKPSVHFEVGEQVQVSDGPFASFNGIVEGVDAERARLKVSVSIFGRSTPVDLEYSQVEKC